MKEYFSEAIRIIGTAFESLEEDKFYALLEQCEQCIKNGGKIIASGLGKNIPICEKFVGTLSSLSIASAFMHANTALHGDMGIVQSNDILILLSKSGNTAEIVSLVTQLLNRGINTWLISFQEQSKLLELVHNSIILYLENEGDKWNIIPNNSASIYLIILQGLAINLANRLRIPLSVFRENHPGGDIGEKLKYIITGEL